MISQILYLICCVCILWEWWERYSRKTISSPPKFPGCLPVIGHAWKLVGDRKLLADPDDCAFVSNACLEKDYYYSFGKPFIGNGLLIADGKKLVQQFKPELGKGIFNHEKHIRLNNLESVCMTTFGADVDLGDLYKQYITGVNDILDVLTERFQKFWLHSDFIYNLSSLKKKQDAIVSDVQGFTSAILRKRKEEMKQNKNSSDKPDQYTPFMNLILELSQDNDSYSDEDILHEINTIVVAGYDTTAFTITLALMLLGAHPEAQKKVDEEMQKVFKNSDRDVDKDDIPKLIYLEAVLKETMRLYPIAPIVARYIVKDVQLKHYTLKAGNGIGMLFWALHRHGIWGKDAEQFRPERWLEGSLTSINNAFAGFSIGKRGCIGKTYAMMSMKTVLSHVLRSYVISSDMSILELEIDSILRLASGQNISIKERR